MARSGSSSRSSKVTLDFSPLLIGFARPMARLAIVARCAHDDAVLRRVRAANADIDHVAAVVMPVKMQWDAANVASPIPALPHGQTKAPGQCSPGRRNLLRPIRRLRLNSCAIAGTRTKGPAFFRPRLTQPERLPAITTDNRELVSLSPLMKTIHRTKGMSASVGFGRDRLKLFAALPARAQQAALASVPHAMPGAVFIGPLDDSVWFDVKRGAALLTDTVDGDRLRGHGRGPISVGAKPSPGHNGWGLFRVRKYT